MKNLYNSLTLKFYKSQTVQIQSTTSILTSQFLKAGLTCNLPNNAPSMGNAALEFLLINQRTTVIRR